MIDLFFKKLEENVKYPLRAHERDAGFDIYLKEDGEDDYIVIMPGKQLKLSTGIAVQGKFTNPEDSKKWVIKFQIEGTSGRKQMSLWRLQIKLKAVRMNWKKPVRKMVSFTLNHAAWRTI